MTGTAGPRAWLAMMPMQQTIAATRPLAVNVARAMRGDAPSSSSGAPYGMKSESDMTDGILPPVACTGSPETMRARPSRGARPVIWWRLSTRARGERNGEMRLARGSVPRWLLRKHLKRLRQRGVAGHVLQAPLHHRPRAGQVPGREPHARLVVVRAAVVRGQALRLAEARERERVALRGLPRHAREQQRFEPGCIRRAPVQHVYGRLARAARVAQVPPHPREQQPVLLPAAALPDHLLEDR